MLELIIALALFPLAAFNVALGIGIVKARKKKSENLTE